MRSAYKALIQVLLVTAILAMFTFSALAFNTYKVGENISGRVYSDLFKSWQKREFSIWAALDGKKKILIFKADVGYKNAEVHLDYDNQLQKKLEATVNQAIEWTKIARENQADTSKGIACLGTDKYELCQKNASAYDTNQASFRFFSSNNGRQTDLIVEIIDRDRKFVTDEFYFDSESVLTLEKIISKIPTRFHEISAKIASTDDLFKKSDDLLKTETVRKKRQKKYAENVLSEVKKLSESEIAPSKPAKPPEPYKKLSTERTPSRRLSAAEINNLLSYLAKCFALPSNSNPELAEQIVDMNLQIRPDGTVENIKIVEAHRMTYDRNFQIVAQAARQAILDCEPLPLPTEKYESWKTLLLGFDSIFLQRGAQ